MPRKKKSQSIDKRLEIFEGDLDGYQTDESGEEDLPEEEEVNSVLDSVDEADIVTAVLWDSSQGSRSDSSSGNYSDSEEESESEHGDAPVAVYDNLNPAYRNSPSPSPSHHSGVIGGSNSGHDQGRSS